MSTADEGCTRLEEAIDAIASSYDGPMAINNLESAALPNRKAVIEAYEHIAPILYLGFYSKRPLSRANLRFSLSEHVYPAAELLCEQIDRALTYEERMGRVPSRPGGFAKEVMVNLLHAVPRLRELLNEDATVAYEFDPAARSVEEVVFSYPTLRAITAHRIAHELHAAGVPLIPRIIAEYAHSHTGIDIHPAAKIGRRFFIDHGTGVVVGETAELGDDVKLYQGVTLGALSLPRNCPDAELRRKKRHPTLRDRVTVYAGATILGGDTVIGEGSVIGGNVWLIRSVPPGSKLFGRSRDDASEAPPSIAPIPEGGAGTKLG